MYHPTIWKLDSAATDFHSMGMLAAKNSAFLLAGQFQLDLVAKSQFKTGRRFLHAQWAWALGHIGLLYQVIRWFRLLEPKTKLVLETPGAANPYFAQALMPFITVYNKLPEEMVAEAQHNAVYFGCPDGIHSLVNFYKMIERECHDIHLLRLSESEEKDAEALLAELGVTRPFVALHARQVTLDPFRNVTVEQIERAVGPFLAKGFSVVSTGLDPHPINDRYPNLARVMDMRRASYLLSATCDQFIGSNSGAWTIAHAYQRPVKLINDYERAAWIYP